jgi:catechol 2,3-dioxygenase-like lactoylglutathione lyase family enzyme
MTGTVVATNSRQSAPAIAGLLETALIVEDVFRSVAFYGKVLGLRAMEQNERLGVMDAGPRQVLLLFRRGGSVEASETPGGTMPGGIDAIGRSHTAFAVSSSDLEGWQVWLRLNEIEVAGDVRWKRGGRSLYFRDPDGNLLELATPGVWENY